MSKSTTHEVMERAAADLGWGFDCSIIRYYETKKIVLTKGQRQITVFLDGAERVMTSVLRRDPGHRVDTVIRGGRDAVIKVMKELS